MHHPRIFSQEPVNAPKHFHPVALGIRILMAFMISGAILSRNVEKIALVIEQNGRAVNDTAAVAHDLQTLAASLGNTVSWFKP